MNMSLGYLDIIKVSKLYVCIFAGSNNVGELFNMAGQVGKAVGTLVTVMTDENGEAIEDGEVILEDKKS